MNYTNINPGIKRGLRQPFTITTFGRIFFLTHDEFNDAIEWNMFMDDAVLKEEIEEILKSYLTNQ
jgi:hypothetical protein